MKRTLLAAAFCATVPFAATAAAPTDVAPARCEPVPKLPGRMQMERSAVLKQFQRDLKQYEECMKTYIEERKAVAKAHQDAANAAVEEYNGVVRALQEAQSERQK